MSGVIEGGLKGDNDGGLAADHPEHGTHGEQVRFPKSPFVLLDVFEQFRRKPFLENGCDIACVLRWRG